MFLSSTALGMDAGFGNFPRMVAACGVGEVAKRFTDTEKWKKRWYRELGSKLRDVRQFILDDCDLAGIWEMDLVRLSSYIGEKVTLEEVKKSLNDECQVLDDGDSLFVPAFIEFQYGTLVETNNAHRAVLKRLRSKEVQPLMSPSRGVQDKDKEKDKDKDQDKDQDSAETNLERAPIKSEEVRDCLFEWQKTREHFGINRPNGMRDEVEITRAVSRFSAEWVRLALLGARKQIKGKSFDPAQFVSLAIYFHKDRIERLVNIGAGKESSEGFDWAAFWKKADGAA